MAFLPLSRSSLKRPLCYCVFHGITTCAENTFFFLLLTDKDEEQSVRSVNMELTPLIEYFKNKAKKWLANRNF